MTKFKNIKKFNGNVVPPTPVPQAVSPQKARRIEPIIVKPIIPLATFTTAPKEKSSVVPEVNKGQAVGKKVEVTTVVEERAVQVKGFVPKQKEAPSLKNKPSIKPRRIGTFVLIMFFAIVLQIILLVSLLYLSPSLIR